MRKYLLVFGLLISSGALLIIPVFFGVGSAALGGVLAFFALVVLVLPFK